MRLVVMRRTGAAFCSLSPRAPQSLQGRQALRFMTLSASESTIAIISGEE
jgi:hypothetical protein